MSFLLSESINFFAILTVVPFPFSERTSTLSSAYTRNIDAFAEAAENLVLDLLAQGDEQ